MMGRARTALLLGLGLVLAAGCQREDRGASGVREASNGLEPYTKCEFGAGLVAVSVDRLPGTGVRHRSVVTAEGERRVSMMDGYRVLLAYPGTEYFANVKVERSAPDEYVSDRGVIVAGLEHLAATGGPAKGTVEHRHLRGFDMVCLNNSTINVPGPISMYVLFNDSTQTVVTVYFLNQRAEQRRFQTFEEYAALRDAFLEDYTKCIERGGPTTR